LRRRQQILKAISIIGNTAECMKSNNNQAEPPKKGPIWSSMPLADPCSDSLSELAEFDFQLLQDNVALTEEEGKFAKEILDVTKFTLDVKNKSKDNKPESLNLKPNFDLHLAKMQAIADRFTAPKPEVDSKRYQVENVSLKLNGKTTQLKHFILGYEGDFTINLNEFSEENIKDNTQDKLLFVGAQASKKELLAVHGTIKDVKTVYDYLSPKKGKLTGKHLKEIFKEAGTSQARCDEVAKLINKYADKFEITMPLRMAHFLGQIGTETGGLKESGLKESTCHRESTVMSLWGNTARPENKKYRKYCGLFKDYNPDLTSCETVSYNNSKGKKVTVSLPAGCKDELLLSKNVTLKSDYFWTGSGTCPTKHLDYVYSCRMGNGAASTGDGSKFAGKGFIHLTGKGMYSDMSDAWNAANPSNPKHFDGADIDELVNNTETALLASLYYWSSFNLNEKSDKGLTNSQIDTVGSIINGSNPPNDFKKRRDTTNLAFKILK
jgi:predicted chitinase